MTPSRRGADGAGSGTLVLITAGIFGMATSVTMIGPLLVDMSREFGVPVGTVGLLAAAAGIPQAIGSPCAGLASDRLGRRPLIVLGFTGVGLTSVASAFAGSFATLILLRVIAGLLGASGPTSLLASVGDLFPAERRASAMGWFNMGFSLAAIAGVPAIGAIDGVFGWRWAFGAMGALALGLAVATALWFPSPPTTVSGTSVLTTYRAVWATPRLVNVLGANLVERSMFIMMTLYLPSFLMLAYAMNAAEAAPFLSVVAIGTVVGNVVGGWLGNRLPKPPIFVAAQAVAGVLALVLFGSTLHLAGAVAVATLFGLANASSRPAFLAFSGDLVPRHRGALFGLLALTNQSGLVLGSAVGGLVIQWGGYGGMAVVAIAQASAAAGLALPLVRPGRAVPLSA